MCGQPTTYEPEGAKASAKGSRCRVVRAGEAVSLGCRLTTWRLPPVTALRLEHEGGALSPQSQPESWVLVGR